MTARRPTLALLLATTLAACVSVTPTSPTPPTPPPVPSAAGTATLPPGSEAVGGTASPSAAATTGVTSAPPAPAADLPIWRTATLTDVRTGETFAIADLAGRLVVVEPMAIWCPNCARQQEAAATALAAIGSPDIVYISLDVDPAETPADLAAYADERGFDWRFAVAGTEVSRSLARALGDRVLAPPGTPKIYITPAGEVLGPEFGMEGADALEARLRSLLSG